MHSLLVELHIHRKKQTEDDSFNFLNVTNECEKYFNLTLHHISPHDCFPEILWLLWGPRCRRHRWDIRIFPWRCRERPEIIDYGLMLCWCECEILYLTDWISIRSVTETHNGFKPGLLHLVETVGVGRPQRVGVLSLGAHCGDYVWNETSESWSPEESPPNIPHT